MKVVAQKSVDKVKSDWQATSDEKNFERIVSSVKWNVLNEAWKYTNKLYSEDRRLTAIRMIAFAEKNRSSENKPSSDTLQKFRESLEKVESSEDLITYRIDLANLTYFIDPQLGREEMERCKADVRKIHDASSRSYSLISFVSFELETTKDVERAKQAIHEAQKSIDLIASDSLKKHREKMLASLMDANSYLLISCEN